LFQIACSLPVLDCYQARGGLHVMSVKRIFSGKNVKAGIFLFFCFFFPKIVLDLSENQGPIAIETRQHPSTP
jgi:hypothetical protein